MKIWLVIAFLCTAHAQPPTLHQPLPIANDTELSEYLTRLANNIAARLNNSNTHTVIVLESESVNAYALPSGELYMTRGLIKAVTNEAELVFVMAQQLSALQLHNKPAYSAQSQTKRPSTGHRILVGLVSGTLIVVGGPLGARVGVMIIAQELGHRSTPSYLPLQTAPAFFITEADKAAVEYLHEAGYDPEAAISMLEKLRAVRPKGYVRQSQLPLPPITFIERIRLLRNRIAKLEHKDEYLLNSSTFKALKRRLGETASPASSDKLQLYRKPLTSSLN